MQTLATEPVTLYVFPYGGGPANLYVAAPDTSGDAACKSQRTYPLKPGLNTVADSGGGMIYLGFVAGSGELSVSELKGAVKAPRFELGRTTPQEYRKALDEAATPQAELVSPHAILTVDVPSALQWRGEDQTALMKGYESIIARHNATAGLNSASGINRPVPLPHHLVLQAGNQGTYAEARDFYTTYTRPLAGELLRPAELGWLVWHELGRQYESALYNSPDFAEVTVNIFFLAAQREAGRRSRLLDVRSDGKDHWDSALEKVGTPGLEYSWLDHFQRLSFL
ncbi:M60 family metallopeptidase [Streptomyces zaomyceticus]|uniref:M60 family metallopeptidase n=1 Tax=Streptomyces zaomyceticus TaxID=68286 RepID=UPI002E209535